MVLVMFCFFRVVFLEVVVVVGMGGGRYILMIEDGGGIFECLGIGCRLIRGYVFLSILFFFEIWKSLMGVVMVLMCIMVCFLKLEFEDWGLWVWGVDVSDRV